MSSWRLTSVARPAQYRSMRSDGSSGVMAAKYVSTSPVPTVRPASRSSRAKPTSTPVKAPGPSATGDDLRQVLPHQVKVVAVFDHRAERVIRRVRRQVRRAEDPERADPVDGFRDTGRLGQV